MIQPQVETLQYQRNEVLTKVYARRVSFEFRCGKDLASLFSTPMHELNCEKATYQPGSLRAVSDHGVTTCVGYTCTSCLKQDTKSAYNYARSATIQHYCTPQAG